MSDRNPSGLSLDSLRRGLARSRPGHWVALGAVGLAVFGLVGLRAVELPGPRPVTDDGRLRIEVVHPVEPEIVPGSVMEVGELVDGFQGVPPPLPPLTDVLWSYDEDWEDGAGGDSSPGSADRRMFGAPVYSRPEPERASPVRTVQRWFGFDAPRRDFQAERAARRARLEAMERRARERHAAERRRHERAELDRQAREGWRLVPRQAPRWREAAGPLTSPAEEDERIASGPATEGSRGGSNEEARRPRMMDDPPAFDDASSGELPPPAIPAPPSATGGGTPEAAPAIRGS